MKKLNYLILFVMTLIVFDSCEKTDLQNDYLLNEEKCDESSEILYFSNNEELNDYYDGIKEGNKVTSDFKSRYNFLTELNEKNNLKSANIESELDLDIEDSLVADPYILQMINKYREIQISDKIYKITKYGTFICEETDIQQLRIQLETNDFKNNLTSLINNFLKTWDNTTRGVLIDIDENLQLYMDLLGVKKNNMNLKSSKIKDKLGVNYLFTDGIDMNTCDESNKTWAGEIIAGLVGYSVNCENYFSSKRREKTVFWSQDFFYKSSIGVKVKTQKKKLGIWWKEQSDEIMLGWNKVVYDVDLNLTNTQLNFNYKGIHYTEPVDLYNKYLEEQYKEWIYVNWPEYSQPFVNLVWFTDVPDLVNRLAYQYSVSYLKNQVKNYIQSLNGPNTDNVQLTIVEPNNKATVVIMPALPAIHSYGQVDEEVIFSEDWSEFNFGMAYTFGGGFQPIFSVNGSTNNYEIKEGSHVFAVVKEEGDWKGSEIIKY